MEEVMLSRGQFLLGAASLLFLPTAGISVRRQKYLLHLRATDADQVVVDVLVRDSRVGLLKSNDQVSDLYIARVGSKPIGLHETKYNYFVHHQGTWRHGALLSSQRVRPGDIVSVGISFV